MVSFAVSTMGKNDNNRFSQVLLVFVILPFCLSAVQPPIVNPGVLNQGPTLGDCQACNIFIESFKKGLERTARGKFEGGDAAWEEEKLKTSYKRSEMRLVDIQEGICKDTKKHSVQCHHMSEKAEEFIEAWWAQDPDESVDLFSYICIDRLLVCCPKHHYGKNCTPCPGDHEHLCSGNGKCRGDGTRKGNGTCLCNVGYTGKDCDQCTTGYYVSYKSEKNMLCSPCHRSCLNGCSQGTQKDCTSCKPGFKFDSDQGCLDVNECNNKNICQKDEFCLNSMGAYTCIKCDKSCDGCRGDGPDMCGKCAKEYSKQGEFCVPDRIGDEELRKLAMNRYMAYVGLLIATGLVLPNSMSFGGVVGAFVLTYIVGAEYYCMINGHEALLNLKDFDLMQLLRT